MQLSDVEAEAVAAALAEARRAGESAMRERCAQVCDNGARTLSGTTPRSEGMLDAYEKSAAAIRAINEQ